MHARNVHGGVRSRWAALVIVLAVLPALDPAHAGSESQQDAGERPWGLEIEPYLWVAGFNGNVGSSQQTVSTGIQFTDILKNLKLSVMGSARLRYRRVGLLVDGTYVKIGENVPSSRLVFLLTGVTDVDLTLPMGLGTTAVFLRFTPTRGLALDPYVGARWWYVESRVLANPTSFFLVADRAWADPVFGLATTYGITDRWFVESTFDVGGGVSKFTWQVAAGVGFDFRPGVGLSVGWRYTGVDYDRDGFAFDSTIQGLLIGLKLRI